MFKATLVEPYRSTHASPFTKGKVYEVLDFSDWHGTYLILNDDGHRACVDWMRFEDQGRAAEDYQRRRDADLEPLT